MLNVETKKVTNQRYFVGSDERILDNMNGTMTKEDLHKDSRLIIVDDFLILTDEQFIDEVKRDYNIEVVQTVHDWMKNDPYGYYYNCVDDELEYSDLANHSQVNEMFVEMINGTDKEAFKTTSLDELYIKCAKKAIINNMRKEADRLEKEWSE